MHVHGQFYTTFSIPNYHDGGNRKLKIMFVIPAQRLAIWNTPRQLSPLGGYRNSATLAAAAGSSSRH
jgi:hypothetical protein